jgi:hypothetical protein
VRDVGYRPQLTDWTGLKLQKQKDSRSFSCLLETAQTFFNVFREKKNKEVYIFAFIYSISCGVSDIVPL